MINLSGFTKDVSGNYTSILASQNIPTITITDPALALAMNATKGGPTPFASVASPSSADTELPTYQFIVGWIFLFVILTFVNKSRIGHVIIYYSLILMILLILVTEYQQIVPLLNSITTIGEFNAKKSAA